MNTIALLCVVAAAIGGLAWVFVYPILSGERKAERREERMAKSAPVLRTAVAARSKKSQREHVEGSLQNREALDARARAVPLALRISQAGLKWSNRQFYMICGSLGILGFLAFFLVAGLVVAVAMGSAVGALPFWILRFLQKRREARFIDGFPDALDIIVRGIKAGLPLLDSLKVISIEAPEPLKSEFRTIVETHAAGTPLGQACGKLYQSITVDEANVFGIVIATHERSGGNLAEAFANLSKALRDRKPMHAKIPAMLMAARIAARHQSPSSRAWRWR